MGTGLDASAARYGTRTALKGSKLFIHNVPDTLGTNETELKRIKLRVPRRFLSTAPARKLKTHAHRKRDIFGKALVS